ncbi:beta-lactamase domain-containing protein [Methyloglobulus morosus KoM1]|uniref:Beta-lactamase domain-containing protein n=1 Tax=Methyloglobulus morosus KoM1 TaxID=1116472 RepID=V5BTR8_9GAMM|nr:MBL fold metallo-hydrolase [Methyloglobulus morosus]ESS71264.1 beta-lactamase domain-containing protein [Methyloglobulus morosus KoM1]
MRRSTSSGVCLIISMLAIACSGPQLQSLQQGADASHPTNIKSIEFSGTGRWYQFGQAPNPDLPWPPFDVKSYTADINYDNVSAKVKIARSQVIEPGRERPMPVEQRVEQFISRNRAWNIAATGNQPAATTAQPAAVEERAAEIWATPQGFLKATLANNATAKDVDGGKEVSFTVGGKYQYVGFLNDKHQLEKVQTWIDNPVLGDTLVETQYSDYKDFGGVQFPGHIVRSQGGYPVLDINVSEVKINPVIDIAIPPEAAKVPEVSVKVNKLAKGVYYLTGGTHHSVAIEQKDHVVLVEAPQNEARSEAVIAKIRETIPNKAIKYLINTHAHFDHSGGLRTFVDEGATIVTVEANQPYYEKVWAQPRTINPDRLAKSQKQAHFETFTDKYVLTDGKRKIELYSIAGNGHNDAFLLAYLPKEKILVEADAYTPPAPNVPFPPKPNPYSVNLYQNIQKLNLDVEKIAALHGPRVVTLADLKTFIGQSYAAN